MGRCPLIRVLNPRFLMQAGHHPSEAAGVGLRRECSDGRQGRTPRCLQEPLDALRQRWAGVVGGGRSLPDRRQIRHHHSGHTGAYKQWRRNGGEHTLV